MLNGRSRGVGPRGITIRNYCRGNIDWDWTQNNSVSLTNCSASYRPCRFPYVASFPALLSDIVLHWRQPLSDLNPGQSWGEPNFWSLVVTSLAHMSPYTLPVTSYSPLWKTLASLSSGSRGAFMKSFPARSVNSWTPCKKAAVASPAQRCQRTLHI